MGDGSKKAVYAALDGNLGIAISMLIAAVFTGSVSMWPRPCIHSQIHLARY
jgi:divalent metal cation (Fe/Co/Zn/Cd) transporter